MQLKLKKLVTAAMLTAIICTVTMVVKIPSPFKGYLNLGDCAVLLSGYMLSPVYGFLAAGLGSALADLLSGYAAYVPATFVIKGTMALIFYFAFKFLNRKIKSILARVLSGIFAEIFMVLGYFLFEGVLYGFLVSAVNIPANFIQGIAGLILGMLLIKTSEKIKTD